MSGSEAARTEGSSAGAAPARPQPPVRPPTILKPATVRIDAVQVTQDITYSTLPGFRPLKLDLYRPESAAGPLPVLIWMHGGGWQAGEPRNGPFFDVDGPVWFAEIAARGYAVASIAYRLAGEATFPAQAQDMWAAVRFLREHAAEYGLDAQTMILSGASAGAYLAVLGGANRDAGEAVAATDGVRGVIAFYPPTDLPTLARDNRPGAGVLASIVGSFMGGPIEACPAERIASADVLGRIDARTPPYLMFHGDADTFVSIEHSQALAEALAAKGGAGELVPVAEADHGLAGVDAAGRASIMDRVCAFLARTAAG